MTLGDLITIVAAEPSGYAAGYVGEDEVWHGCLHDPHRDRHAALACAEARLALDLRSPA